MPLFSRLLGPRRRKNREEVAGRARDVIAQVLFDVGIDRFLNGSMLLDRQFRLRFFAVPPRQPDALATLALRDLAEAHVLRAYLHDALLQGADGASVARHARLLAEGLMRELLARSPELRALPARRSAAVLAIG